MDNNTFIEYLKKLDNNDALTMEEIKDIDIKASKLVNLMQEGKLEPNSDMQNALDYYIAFYDGARYLDDIKNKNIMKYYSVIEEKNSKKISAEKQNKPRVLKLKPINSDGLIGAITIIETVIIGGILLAFLALALLKI